MSILSIIKENKITNRAKQRTEAFNYLFDEAVDDVSGGEFYFFEYKPKFRKKLKHWDRYPLVIMGDSTSDGFYGANLHYMKPIDRINLAEKIINKEGVTIPKFIWHRYIMDKADNLFFRIPEEDVLEMVTLPLEQFYDNRNKFVSASKVQI
tara:strand:- start:351 stop:803 length:453 start_codon:yes stop_codon:yes gene_type:complete